MSMNSGSGSGKNPVVLPCKNLDADDRENRERLFACQQLAEDYRVEREEVASPTLLAYVPESYDDDKASSTNFNATATFASTIFGNTLSSTMTSTSTNMTGLKPSPPKTIRGWCICRRIPGTVVVDGWSMVYDPQETKDLPVKTEVMVPIKGWYGLYKGVVVQTPSGVRDDYVVEVKWRAEEENTKELVKVVTEQVTKDRQLMI